MITQPLQQSSMPLRLIVLLIISLLIGAMALVVPWLFAFDDFDLRRRLGWCFAAAWTGVLVLSIMQHGFRGLWAMVGAPVAFYWPWSDVSDLIGVAKACARDLSQCL
jgi:hypothetical protein